MTQTLHLWSIGQDTLCVIRLKGHRQYSPADEYWTSSTTFFIVSKSDYKKLGDDPSAQRLHSFWRSSHLHWLLTLKMNKIGFFSLMPFSYFHTIACYPVTPFPFSAKIQVAFCCLVWAETLLHVARPLKRDTQLDFWLFKSPKK